MDDKEIMSQMMDWVETLLLRTWVMQVVLDHPSRFENWREIVERQEILAAPLLHSRIASLRAAILEDHSSSVAPQDWQEISESLIQSVDGPDLEKQ